MGKTPGRVVCTICVSGLGKRTFRVKGYRSINTVTASRSSSPAESALNVTGLLGSIIAPVGTAAS